MVVALGANRGTLCVGWVLPVLWCVSLTLPLALYLIHSVGKRKGACMDRQVGGGSCRHVGALERGSDVEGLRPCAGVWYRGCPAFRVNGGKRGNGMKIFTRVLRRARGHQGEGNCQAFIAFAAACSKNDALSPGYWGCKLACIGAPIRACQMCSMHLSHCACQCLLPVLPPSSDVLLRAERRPSSLVFGANCVAPPEADK